ncbi:MAG: hypothetical protein ACPGOY_02975 [Rhodospirillaceae bacterium]
MRGTLTAMTMMVGAMLLTVPGNVGASERSPLVQLADSSAQLLGARVLAQWPADGLWYPGTITETGDHLYVIAFDDGDRATVDGNGISPLSWGRGNRVACNRQPGGNYFAGVIAGRSGDQLQVTFSDGSSGTRIVARCRSRQPGDYNHPWTY